MNLRVAFGRSTHALPSESSQRSGGTDSIVRGDRAQLPVERSAPGRRRARSRRPVPPSVVSSQTPAIAPTRLEPVSPSIARSRSVNQAPTRTGPAKIPSSSSGAIVAGARAEAGAEQRQPLLGPPRPQVEQVEEVGGEDQQRHVGQVAPRLQAAAGDDVGGEGERPDRLDRPGREAAPRAAPARGRASRAAPPPPRPAPASRRGSRGRRRRSGRGSSGAGPGRAVRGRRGRRGRRAGPALTSAAVASTAPSGKASSAPR